MIAEQVGQTERLGQELVRVTVATSESLGEAACRIAAGLAEAGLTPHELFGTSARGGCQVSAVFDPGQLRDVLVALLNLGDWQGGTRICIAPVSREVVASPGSLADLVISESGRSVRWAVRSGARRWLITDREATSAPG